MEVELIFYLNPTSDDCKGENCDETFGTCDNVFHFCLRVVGGVSCLASLGTNYVEDDSMTFSSHELSRLGISNPLVFSRISTSVRRFCMSYLQSWITALRAIQPDYKLIINSVFSIAADFYLSVDVSDNN